MFSTSFRRISASFPMDGSGSPRPHHSAGEEAADMHSDGPESGTAVDPYLRMAIYNAFANVALILFGVTLFGLYLLLQNFLQPLLWAGLCAVLLKGYKDSLVEFWVPFLEQGISAAFTAPFLWLQTVCTNVGLDIWKAARSFSKPVWKRLLSKGSQGGFEKLKRRRSRPANRLTEVKLHTNSEILFEWLAAFGVASLAWSGLRLHHGLLALLCVLTTWAVFEMVKDNLQTDPVAKTSTPSVDSLWSRMLDRVKAADRALGRSVLSRLHTLVTVGLVAGLLAGALALIAFFSFAIVMETKTGVEGLNAQVQQHGSKFADSMGVTKWLAENDVPAMVNRTYESVLGTAKEQFDELVVRYNLTEVVETVHDSLDSLWDANDSTLKNGTVLATRPASKLAERVKGIRTRLLAGEFYDAVWEIRAVAALWLTKLPVSAEQLREYLQLAQSTGTAALRIIVGHGSTMFAGGATLFVSSLRIIFSGAMGFVNFTLQAGFFLTILYAMLSAEEGAASNQILGLLPFSEKQKTKITDALCTAISGVLLCSVKLAFFQTAFTWLLFRAFHIHFLYTCTLLAGLNAVLPLIPNWLSSLPAGLQLMAGGNYIGGIALVIAHNLMLGQGSDIIYGDIPGSQPYLTGLSVVGGMSMFDSPIQGAIFGPLILTIFVALRNLYSEFVGEIGSAG